MAVQPDDPQPAPELQRADTQSMLTYIHGARIVSIAHEVALGRLRAWLVDRIFSGVALAVVVILAAALLDGSDDDRYAWFVATLTIVMLTARLGAIVSIGRRMGSEELSTVMTGDSIFTLASLGAGRAGLSVALLTAPLFGLVLLAIFASGISNAIGLSGGIFPAFTDTRVNSLRDLAEADRIDAVMLKQETAALVDACAATGTAAAQIAPAETPVTPPAAADDQAEGTADAVTSPAPEPAPAAATDAAPDAAPAAAPAPVDRCAPSVLEAALARVAAAERKAALSAAAASEPSALPPRAGTPVVWMAQLSASLGLDSVPDLWKLLFWVFLSGFFEQLVPDMLDSIRGRAAKRREVDGAPR